MKPVNEELAKKMWRQLEQEVLQGWMDSELKLSSQYEFLSKTYRFKLKNDTLKDRVSGS